MTVKFCLGLGAVAVAPPVLGQVAHFEVPMVAIVSSVAGLVLSALAFLAKQAWDDLRARVARIETQCDTHRTTIAVLADRLPFQQE